MSVPLMVTPLAPEGFKLEIVEAKYGEEGNYRDVTDVVRGSVCGLPFVQLPSSHYNTAFGGDPAPGVVKELKVQYRMDGKAGEAVFPEDATVLLPMLK